MLDNIIKSVVKSGDEIVTNGIRKGANSAATGAKKTARVLKKKDYSGSNFNRFKADMAVVSAQRMDEPKPLFKDDDGALFYHQFNGSGSSQFRNRDAKQAEVLNRSSKGKQQSKEGVTGKTFLKDRPQVADTEAHHIAPIKSLQFLFDGLDRADSERIINYFEKRGVYIGNDPRNRADLSSARHTSVHESYAKKAILKYDHASLEGMSLEDRMVFVDQIIKEIKEARKLFKEGEMFYSMKDFTDGYNAAFKPGALVEEPTKGSK